VTRMRIAMISEHASPLAMLGGVDAGGQNIHVAELASALARRGHEVRVYTRRDRADLPDVVPFDDGVLVEHVPAGPARALPKDDLLPFMGEFGRRLAARWDAGEFTPTVVHAHFWMSGLAALTATASRRVPVVVTYHALGVVKRRHQGGRDTSPPTREGLERELGLLADRVVAQCADEVDELTRMGIPRSGISMIPSGVNIERFGTGGPVARRPVEGHRILTVGRLVPRKGFEDVIRAMRAVPDTELVIAGGPPAAQLRKDPEAGRLRALAQRAGVADRVRLLGSVPREEMPAWYRSADVLACAPWYEPFGLTPLEAMACGVPVVAYAVGGLAESVIDGVTGVLVSPRDVRALAGALRSLLGDDVLRMSYASAAVDRVRSRYPWERTAADVERVYAAVTGDAMVAGGTLSEVPS
jgi:glycosyltransferase involved in cell wall biosynthesis